MSANWEFWIDVGGTFTDCLARNPDGKIQIAKILSSGVTSGVVEEFFSPIQFSDPARGGEPKDFWVGYTLRLLDEFGNPRFASRVISSSPNGSISVAAVFPADLPDHVRYELKSHEEAPILAVRKILGLKLNDEIPPVTMKLGTTRGTNALLTRRGARTVFVTTRGFGDILKIGNQDRPKLFELKIVKPEPLFQAVLEVDERVTFNGKILRSPDRNTVSREFQRLREEGYESLAICLLHGYSFPAHEQLLAEWAREAGFEEVSTSHQTAPLIKIVSRGDTTTLDAYLTPVIRSYVERIERSLGPSSQLFLMSSTGGLGRPTQFTGKDSLLSGPAGGVVGFARVAQQAGFTKAIGFDMGGTSTDVSRFDGQFEWEFETVKAGVRVVSPMMSIETVAAGGGSICGFDGIRLTVGPASAGSDPGPACYGRGGPLSMTDINQFLGRLPEDRFPIPLHPQMVQGLLEKMVGGVERISGVRYTCEQLAEGFVEVANANMVRAIRKISVARGYDPSEYVLVTFGGAGGQHACAVARALGIRKILSHPWSGLLSAYGIGQADIRRFRVQSVLRPWSDVRGELDEIFKKLETEARQEVLASGGLSPPLAQVQISPGRRTLGVRYVGVEAALEMEVPEDGDVEKAFRNEHRRLYGYEHPRKGIEILTARVEVTGHLSSVEEEPGEIQDSTPEPARFTEISFEGTRRACPLFFREQLKPGAKLQGPCLVCEETSTLFIEPGFDVQVLARGELLVEHQSQGRIVERQTESNPIQLEVVNNQFASIAEQMGIVLQRTASSTNVKERLDFSCAIFDPKGGLVVNAPHIPVHLGAMSETVRRILQDNPEIAPGDVYVTNDPYRGGSHLPDVTVITPVYGPQGELRFLTASRAHHAEIGGIVPGSMPPFSNNLAEEGVLIRNFKLVDQSEYKEEEIKKLLLSGKYPTRNVADNLADIAAQVAANRVGARLLEEYVARAGWNFVSAYMGHIQAAAESKVLQVLRRLSGGKFQFADHLDNGLPIQVTIEFQGERAVVDFSGTGPVGPGNLHANRAIVTAAVLYVFRCMINEDIPLNGGVLHPIEIRIPESLLNPPEHDDPSRCAAIVGGNVEVSQRVVDVLLGALGLAAASQGTMNNLTFGNSRFGYYETICGGSGATSSSHGTEAVHTHMTNTRMTDVEVIERRFPVRIKQFAIRPGSGGEGEYHGGDGIVREIEFLEPLEVSILSERRGAWAPFGLCGGQPGAKGKNTLLGKNREVDLSGKAHFEVSAGDILRIETPGGGGYGPPSHGERGT